MIMNIMLREQLGFSGDEITNTFLTITKTLICCFCEIIKQCMTLG